LVFISLRATFWGIGRVAFGAAKALQVDQLADAGWPHAGIVHDHIATHAVADQVDRGVARVVVQQEFQIRQVIVVPVVVDRSAGGKAIAAPVGGDDVALGETI
jgi:hypothetical protein